MNKKEEPVIPENILSEEKFTQLLVDFALAESAANMNVGNVSTQKMDTVYAFDPLKENDVTMAQYDSSVSFYSHHIDLYKKIYENVLATLNEMQAKRGVVKKDSTLK